MKAPLTGWLEPCCDSRTGASHLRRGAPCQDASGVLRGVDGAGLPLQALVVSDGHGGSRYDRSAVGSRIACRVALEELRQQFAGVRLQPADGERWRLWLAETLPQRLVRRWGQEVLAHAERHPRPDGDAPSTVPYGATLGLLLLTPHWWGYSGLGDWDLVRVSADGQAELISEEPAEAGSGEATCSLCMEGAARFFAGRSALEPIAASQLPFSLLLSSDGIRKSCGSDEDFLTLARYLAELPPGAEGKNPDELAQALDHISSQGSGDDVSVAIGRWGAGVGRQGQPLLWIVQPGLESPPEAPHLSRNAPPQAPVAPSQPAASAQPRPRSGVWRWLPIAGPVVLTALILGIAGLLHWGPLARLGPRPEPTPPLDPWLPLIQAQATELCSPEPLVSDRAGGVVRGAASELPARIRATLNQRKTLFVQLQRGLRSPGPILADPRQDPLGTLIAWSFRQPRLNPAALMPPPAPAAGPAPARLLLCPALRDALRQQWLGANAAEPDTPR